MTLRKSLRKKIASFLIIWPEEDSATALPADKVVTKEEAHIGAQCTVQVGKGIYNGKIAAIGPYEEMKQLERRFEDNTWTPFCDVWKASVKKGETEAKEGETEAKKVEMEAKKGDTEAKEGETDAKKGETEAKEGEKEGETEAKEGEKEGETDAKEGETDAKEGETDAKKGETKAKEGEKEGETDAKEGETDAKKGETEAKEGETTAVQSIKVTKKAAKRKKESQTKKVKATITSRKKVKETGDLLFAGLLPPIGSDDDTSNPSAKYNYSGARVEAYLQTKNLLELNALDDKIMPLDNQKESLSNVEDVPVHVKDSDEDDAVVISDTDSLHLELELMEMKETLLSLQTSQKVTRELLANVLETQRVQQEATSTIRNRLHLLEKNTPIQSTDFPYGPGPSSTIQHQLSSLPSTIVSYHNNPAENYAAQCYQSPSQIPAQHQQSPAQSPVQHPAQYQQSSTQSPVQHPAQYQQSSTQSPVQHPAQYQQSSTQSPVQHPVHYQPSSDQSPAHFRLSPAQSSAQNHSSVQYHQPLTNYQLSSAQYQHLPSKFPKPSAGCDMQLMPTVLRYEGETHSATQVQTTGNSNSQLARALPLRSVNSGTSMPACLPSSEIPKDRLKAANDILLLNYKLRVPAKISTLAVKLAKEAFFGDTVLEKCTVAGERGFPGLPVQELQDLKNYLFMQFPQLWAQPVEFEPMWRTCCEALGQACKRLRDKKKCVSVPPVV